MPTLRLLSVVAAVSLWACAGGPARGSDALKTRFETTLALRAAKLAPDFFARAERARQESGRHQGEVAADHQTRARLLLEAAEAEADRIGFERQRAAAEARVGSAMGLHADNERARRVVDAESARLAAAVVAGREARRVYAQAELDEGKKRNRAEREKTRLEARAFMLKRAALVLAAASAMGADTDATEPARAAYQRARAADAARPGSTLLAERALAAAQRSLGAARRARGAPTPQEVADLLARGAEMGLKIQPLPRGVMISIKDAFSGKGAKPTARAVRQLAQVKALVRAHPHGPVRIEAHAPGSAGGRRQKLAVRRAERVRKLLIEGESTERLQPEPRAHAVADDNGLDLVFSAYAVGHGP